MSQIIAVINQKGGVGKTTSAVNVAAYLARSNRSVLLVDSDPQANATSGLGIDKHQVEHSIYDLLAGSTDLSMVTLATHVPGLSIIPAVAKLASLEQELAALADRENILKAKLNNAAPDYIIIDCPPALGLLTVNALVAAHRIIIPVQTEYYALEGLSQLLSVVQEIQKSLNPDISILGVLLTMYDSRTGLSSQVRDEVVKYFEDKVFDTVIPRNIRLAEAPSFGRTIFEHDRWSKGARAYKQLTKEIISRVEN